MNYYSVEKRLLRTLKKIIDVQPAPDGIRFSESNRQKPRLVLYDHPNGAVRR